MFGRRSSKIAGDFRRAKVKLGGIRLLVLAAVMILGLPADVSSVHRVSTFGLNQVEYELCHGWPLTFLHRRVVSADFHSLRVWTITEGVTSWSLLALIINAVFAGSVAVLLDQCVRRYKPSAFRFGLRSLLLVTAAFALALGSVTETRKAAEKELLARRKFIGRGTFVELPAGPLWLRQLVGDEIFVCRDRIVQVHLSGALDLHLDSEADHEIRPDHLSALRCEDVAQLLAFGQLEGLSIQLMSIECDSLLQLRELPNLCAIDVKTCALSGEMVAEGTITIRPVQ